MPTLADGLKFEELCTMFAPSRALLACVFLGGCAHSGDSIVTLEDSGTVTASLSASALRAHVEYLAADEREGRGPGTEGLLEAAAYLEAQLEDLGLEPAFGASYRQAFMMLVRTERGAANTLLVAETPLELDEAFAPFAFSASAEVEGDAHFLGYGITANEHGYDDYAEQDVQGKILVVYSGEPQEDDPHSVFSGKKRTRHSALRSKTLLAREAKAAAILIIRDELVSVGGLRSRVHSDAGIVALQITAAAAKQILGFDPAPLRAKIDATGRPASRAGAKTVAARADLVRHRASTANIGAILRAPAAVKEEFVVLGAHYDHLGHGDSGSLAESDAPQIHNGADDNASGTAAVIEAAAGLRHLRSKLKRSIIFVLFAGEERGLLGSSHFTKNPPVGIEQIAAMVNLDMIGRLRNETLNVMGTASASGFNERVKGVAAPHGLKLLLNEDAYGPSDHSAFYGAGIPVLFLFTGAHEHYHRPTDDIETLNYPGLATVAGVASELVFGFASEAERPTYQHLPAPKAPVGGGGYGPFFGSIPDFAQDSGGVRLSGVRKGGPAERAGVRKGDVIVRFAGIQIENLMDFTQALRGTAPGDRVEVLVERNGERLRFEAVLEKRGGH